MSVLSILESRFKDLREEISKMEIEYECKNDELDKIRNQIGDLSQQLEIIEKEMVRMENKIGKMKTAESDMKNTYENIVNSAAMLLDTMETTSYESADQVTIDIEENDDDTDEGDGEVDNEDLGNINYSLDFESGCDTNIIMGDVDFEMQD